MIEEKQKETELVNKLLKIESNGNYEQLNSNDFGFLYDEQLVILIGYIEKLIECKDSSQSVKLVSVLLILICEHHSQKLFKMLSNFDFRILLQSTSMNKTLDTIFLRKGIMYLSSFKEHQGDGKILHTLMSDFCQFKLLATSRNPYVKVGYQKLLKIAVRSIKTTYSKLSDSKPLSEMTSQEEFMQFYDTYQQLCSYNKKIKQTATGRAFVINPQRNRIIEFRRKELLNRGKQKLTKYNISDSAQNSNDDKTKEFKKVIHIALKKNILAMSKMVRKFDSQRVNRSE